MSEGTTLYCGDNCNHTGPHRYRPTPAASGEAALERLRPLFAEYEAADLARRVGKGDKAANLTRYINAGRAIEAALRAESGGLDARVLWSVLAGVGVIANGTWVAFTREDADSIAEAYAAEYARLVEADRG